MINKGLDHVTTTFYENNDQTGMGNGQCIDKIKLYIMMVDIYHHVNKHGKSFLLDISFRHPPI